MFYGWKLATIGSCGNLLLQGSVFYTMNAFIEPLVELHGWSRAGIGLSMTFASAMMTLSMPIGIMLTNKISIRLLMTLGAFIGGLSYVGLGYVDDIRLFAALFAIVWVCGQICGGVVAAGSPPTGAVLSGWSTWGLPCPGRSCRSWPSYWWIRWAFHGRFRYSAASPSCFFPFAGGLSAIRPKISA